MRLVSRVTLKRRCWCDKGGRCGGPPKLSLQAYLPAPQRRRYGVDGLVNPATKRRVVCCFARAKAAQPAAFPADAVQFAEGFKAGDRVTVGGDEPAPTLVEGELIALSSEHIAIRRAAPEVGDVAVHFPRIGYVVKKV